VCVCVCVYRGRLRWEHLVIVRNENNWLCPLNYSKWFGLKSISYSHMHQIIFFHLLYTLKITNCDFIAFSLKNKNHIASLCLSCVRVWHHTNRIVFFKNNYEKLHNRIICFCRLYTAIVSISKVMGICVMEYVKLWYHNAGGWWNLKNPTYF
jgi:hypothetical protein